LSVFHKLLSQNAVGENPQKNCPATQVQMDQLRHIATQNMPNNMSKCQRVLAGIKLINRN